MVCALGTDLTERYGPTEILDVVLPMETGGALLRSALLSAGCLSVAQGEVDALGPDGDWAHAYFHDATFTIFGKQGQLCHLMLVEGVPCFVIGSEDVADTADVVHIPMLTDANILPASTVASICVRVNEPAATAELFLR